ncbi:hypothetical protein SLA2020_028900 [Shorea laevis]
MKIISWNCWGAAKSNFHKGAMDLKHIHNPSMMLILETKLIGQDARDQAASLGFPNLVLWIQKDSQEDYG